MDERHVRFDSDSRVPKGEPAGPTEETNAAEGTLAAPPAPRHPTAWGTGRRSRRRPFGVYAIIALFFLQSLTYGLVVAAAWDNGASMDLRQRTVALVGGTFLGLLTLSIVIGLLLLRRAALVAAIILQGASLSVSIWGYFHSSGSLVTLALGAATVFYLNQRQVQAAFKPGRSARAGAMRG